VEAEGCPASVSDRFFYELQSSPDTTMSDEKGCCPFDPRLSIETFSRMSIQIIVYYITNGNDAVHNGDIARRGKALGKKARRTTLPNLTG
jgi:hypothetical protein